MQADANASVCTAFDANNNYSINYSYSNNINISISINISNIVAPMRAMLEIATPVCGLARNDSGGRVPRRNGTSDERDI